MTPQELDKKLEKAYQSMVKHTQEALSNFEEHTLPAIQEALAKAKEKAIELEELTEEEAEKIAHYLKRDIQAVGKELKTSGQELETLVKNDLILLGNKFWEMIASNVDESKIELFKFEKEFCHPVEYKTGEVTAAGTLVCNSCGHKIVVEKSRRIPKCPACKATVFSKVS